MTREGAGDSGQKIRANSGKSRCHTDGIDPLESEMREDQIVLEKYGDIIHTDWKGVRRHPHADYRIRAAQFAPFSALSGYDDELARTARPVEEKTDLTESARLELDQKLRMILESPGQEEMEIEYFQADPCKKGGTYRKYRGYLKGLDLNERSLCMEDGLRISMGEIRRVEIL